jgi:hypothetical protein
MEWIKMNYDSYAEYMKVLPCRDVLAIDPWDNIGIGKIVRQGEEFFLFHRAECSCIGSCKNPYCPAKARDNIVCVSSFMLLEDLKAMSPLKLKHNEN